LSNPSASSHLYSKNERYESKPAKKEDIQEEEEDLEEFYLKLKRKKAAMSGMNFANHLPDQVKRPLKKK